MRQYSLVLFVPIFTTSRSSSTFCKRNLFCQAQVLKMQWQYRQYGNTQCYCDASVLPLSANMGIWTNICATWIPTRLHPALSRTTPTPNIAFALVDGLQGAIVIIIIISKLLSKAFWQTVWPCLAQDFRVWLRLALKEASLCTKTPAENRVEFYWTYWNFFLKLFNNIQHIQ